ncbi:hypothetical protein [Nocardioides sp. URHA0020]|uniref:hypothetical protein n=1 Tax=Nocardioides sp. URHA0020 TaxID=1380392 RepID=UPI00048BEBFA|nr:hypothetical protein [Nocardioides sp. URHA0020]
MNFTPNPQGINNLFAGIASKIEAIDKELRARYTGQPADTIVEPARTAFARIGVNMTGDLDDYTRSIEENKPFQIELR